MILSEVQYLRESIFGSLFAKKSSSSLFKDGKSISASEYKKDSGEVILVGTFYGATVKEATTNGKIHHAKTNINTPQVLYTSKDYPDFKGKTPKDLYLYIVNTKQLPLIGVDFNKSSIELYAQSNNTFIACDFKGMYSSNLHLDGANFIACDFSRADMSGIDFGKANIDKSVFYFTNLSKANLSNAKNIYDGQFQDSKTAGTTFPKDYVNNTDNIPKYHNSK